MGYSLMDREGNCEITSVFLQTYFCCREQSQFSEKGAYTFGQNAAREIIITLIYSSQG
jgi:hypothetical protein